MKTRKASEALASARARIEALEAELAAVLAHACGACGRPLHPRAARCSGCEIDAQNAAELRALR